MNAAGRRGKRIKEGKVDLPPIHLPVDGSPVADKDPPRSNEVIRPSGHSTYQQSFSPSVYPQVE